MTNSFYLMLFSILLFSGTYLYLMNPKRTFNRLNALALFLSAGVVVTEWNISNSSHPYDVEYYGIIRSNLIGLVALSELLCAMYFARPFESFVDEKKINAGVAVFLGLICLCMAYFTFEAIEVLPNKIDGEWKYIIDGNGWQGKLKFLWFIFIILEICSCFFIAYQKTVNVRERMLKFWLFIGFSVVPIFLYIYFLWIPRTSAPGVFGFSPYLFSGVMILCAIYSYFDFLELNPLDAMEDILESVSNLVVITDVDFMVKHKNELAKEILFPGENNPNPNMMEILEKSQGIDIAQFKSDIKKLEVGEKVDSYFDLEADGVVKNYFLISSKVIKKSNHIGYSFVGMDISTMVEKEKELQDNNVQLEQSNQELERFAYIASHDLKSPLRNIISFLSLLKRKLKTHPDQDVKDFLDITESNAQSMYNLVEEILEYSRVKSAEIKKGKVDMNEVLNLIEKNLSHYLEEKNANIKYEKMPIIEANNHQMVQLFQNLIENGLKYNVSAQPKVTISFFQENGKLVFKVEDNGIGINPEYHKKVFEIFKRLHNQSQYKGSGVGLAICNKIANNHGGEIELISVENVGSIFMVNLEVNILEEEDSTMEILKSLN